MIGKKWIKGGGRNLKGRNMENGIGGATSSRGVCKEDVMVRE
jgi:hypothetical protein